MKKNQVLMGGRELLSSTAEIQGGYVNLHGESFYRIRNYDRMDPFFISVVSDSNHWMFVSSNGALTCGRRNPASALFPYVTEDKIHDSQELTGPRTMVLA
ncbi:MAG TPA: hypothetical protein VJ904_08260, partial [Tichowtungia sp.]|nr:hypothetical protein [Tichowtungia sp.]